MKSARTPSIGASTRMVDKVVRVKINCIDNIIQFQKEINSDLAE